MFSYSNETPVLYVVNTRVYGLLERSRTALSLSYETIQVLEANVLDLVTLTSTRITPLPTLTRLYVGPSFKPFEVPLAKLFSSPFKQGGIGIELWSMTEDILFDNVRPFVFLFLLLFTLTIQLPPDLRRRIRSRRSPPSCRDLLGQESHRRRPRRCRGSSSTSI